VTTGAGRPWSAITRAAALNPHEDTRRLMEERFPPSPCAPVAVWLVRDRWAEVVTLDGAVRLSQSRDDLALSRHWPGVAPRHGTGSASG
jgi:hypothetical protein